MITNFYWRSDYRQEVYLRASQVRQVALLLSDWWEEVLQAVVLRCFMMESGEQCVTTTLGTPMLELYAEASVSGNNVGNCENI